MSSKRSTNTSTKRLIKSTQAGIKKVSRGNKAAEGFLTALLFVAILGFFAWQNGYLDGLLRDIGYPQLTINKYANLDDGYENFQDIDWHWSVDEAPNYYKVLGRAVIDYSLEPGNIEYYGIDSLGRTGRVNGCLTYDMVEASAGWRQDFSSDASKIPGISENRQGIIYYPNGEVTENVWLLNKSHLIGDMLGSESSRQSAICGTRTQNVGSGTGGMLFCENIAVEWLNENKAEGNFLWYSAVPLYNSDELIPRAVVVNMKSSDGKVDFQIIVYNTMLGYDMNYYTGELLDSEVKK